MNEKSINKIYKFKKEIAKEYGIPESAIVWAGNNNFQFMKDGQLIKIG